MKWIILLIFVCVCVCIPFKGTDPLKNLNQDSISNLYRPITVHKIERSLKTQQQQQQKFLGIDGFSNEFCKNFKEELRQIFVKIFHRIETVGTLQNPFNGVTVTLITKPLQYQMRRNSRPFSLIDTQTLNKIIAN